MAAHPHELKKIYIVPTGHGLVFLGLIVVVILVAASSGNNLIYGLAFILFSVFIMCMISTNMNLKSLRVEWIGHDDFFAGQPGQILLRMSHTHGRSHYLISAQTQRMEYLKSKPIAGTISEIAPRQGAMLLVPATFKKRGVYPCPRISISTVYPLGLFRSWTYYSPDEEILVFPELLEVAEPLPESIDAGVGDSQLMSRDSQHEHVREYCRFQ